MSTANIEYIIDDTHKEVYGFCTMISNIYYYDRIHYVSRNDKYDVWGDHPTHFIDLLHQKLDSYVRAHGFKDWVDYRDNPSLSKERKEHSENIRKIMEESNPTNIKTKHGEFYLVSDYDSTSLPTPKLSIYEIKDAIRCMDFKVTMKPFGSIISPEEFV